MNVIESLRYCAIVTNGSKASPRVKEVPLVHEQRRTVAAALPLVRLTDALVVHMERRWGFRMSIPQIIALAWESTGRGQAFVPYSVKLRARASSSDEAMRVRLPLLKTTYEQMRLYAQEIDTQIYAVLQYVLETYARTILLSATRGAALLRHEDLAEAVDAMRPPERGHRVVDLAATDATEMEVVRSTMAPTAIANLYEPVTSWSVSARKTFNKWIAGFSNARWTLRIHSHPILAAESGYPHAAWGDDISRPKEITPWAEYEAIRMWRGRAVLFLLTKAGPVSDRTQPFPNIPVGARINAFQLHRHIDWQRAQDAMAGNAGQYLPSRSEHTLRLL